MASTIASGSRLLAKAAPAAMAGPESRRIGSSTTVASTPISSAWRRAKKRKASLVITIGGANRSARDPHEGLLVSRLFADQRQELLGHGVARHRPQTRAGTAGEDQWDNMTEGIKITCSDGQRDLRHA